MSYILEALKKSEQTRQQNAPTPRYSLQPAIVEDMTPRRLWPYVLAAIALLVAAAGVLLLRPAPTTPNPESKIPQVTRSSERRVEKAASILPAPAKSEIESPMAHSRSGREPPPARVASAPVPAEGHSDALTRTRPGSEAQPLPVKPLGQAPGTMPASGAKRPAKAEREAAGPDATRRPQEKIATREELPTALQKALPKLAVAGFIREEGSDAMVVVDDKLLREGEEVMPDLKLEKILADGVVFNYKGYRFRQ